MIWIDSFLKSEKKLKNVLKRKDVRQGHPVVVSTCLSSYELEVLFHKYGLDSLGIKYISAEMFSIYDKTINKFPYFSFDFNSFFVEKDLTFFTKEKNNLQGTGNIKIINIE